MRKFTHKASLMVMISVLFIVVATAYVVLLAPKVYDALNPTYKQQYKSVMDNYYGDHYDMSTQAKQARAHMSDEQKQAVDVILSEYARLYNAAYDRSTPRMNILPDVFYDYGDADNSVIYDAAYQLHARSVFNGDFVGARARIDTMATVEPDPSITQHMPNNGEKYAVNICQINKSDDVGLIKFDGYPETGSETFGIQGIVAISPSGEKMINAMFIDYSACPEDAER